MTRTHLSADALAVLEYAVRGTLGLETELLRYLEAGGGLSGPTTAAAADESRMRVGTLQRLLALLTADGVVVAVELRDEVSR